MGNELARVGQPESTELVAYHSYDELVHIARAIAKSQLFGVKTEDQAIALCLIAQAEGRHPASAAMEYNIIRNVPSLTADAMLARHQRSGGTVEWVSYTDECVEGIFRYGIAEASVKWDTAKASKAGLLNKDNWITWPAPMRRARCISEGVRTVNPGCLSGMYTPDEVQEFAPRQASKPENETQSHVIEAEIIDAPPADDTPKWHEIWPLETHIEFKVSKVAEDTKRADCYWYKCTHDGVTALAFYAPSTPDSKAAAKSNLVTDRITAKVVSGGDYPKLQHVKFAEDTAKCPPVQGKQATIEEAAAEVSGELSPGN